MFVLVCHVLHVIVLLDILVCHDHSNYNLVMFGYKMSLRTHFIVNMVTHLSMILKSLAAVFTTIVMSVHMQD